MPWICDRGGDEREENYMETWMGKLKDKRVIKLGLVFRYVVTYIWLVETISICPQNDTWGEN